MKMILLGLINNRSLSFNSDTKLDIINFILENKVMRNIFIDSIKESIEVKKQILDIAQIDKLEIIAKRLWVYNKRWEINALWKWWICSRCSTFSAEFLIRLRPNVNRDSLPAITLAQDTSTITACGNDFGFDKLFERNLLQ